MAGSFLRQFEGPAFLLPKRRENMLHLGLLIAAFVVFVLAAIGTPARINLTAIGLALLTLAFLFPMR